VAILKDIFTGNNFLNRTPIPQEIKARIGYSTPRITKPCHFQVNGQN
jgi:hypothetical protein